MNRLIRRRVLAGALPVALFGAIAGSAAHPPAQASAPDVAVLAAASVSATATEHVSMRNNRFVSDFLVVPVGSTVVFTNEESDPTRNHDVSAFDGSFYSPSLLPGESWTYTFTAEGFYQYYCSFHENMEAAILVVPAE